MPFMARSAGADDDLGELGHHGALDRVERGLEQGLFAAEVVVERAFGHPGALGDLVQRGGRVPPFGEEVDRTVHKGMPCGLGVLQPPGPHCHHRHNITTYRRYVPVVPSRHVSYREYAADQRYDLGHEVEGATP
jgi:hypothetical protein